MSARLTKSDREQMAKALVRHKFHEQAEALMQESVELFDAVYDERHDAQTQRLMRQLQKLHPNTFYSTTTQTVNANGYNVRVGAAAVGRMQTVLWTPQVVPRLRLDSAERQVSPALADRVADFALRLKAFTDSLDPAYSTATAALAQFSTGKKLAEDWPEAMPVIGNLIPASERNLPVVQLTAINDEFGLPPSEVEAA